MIPLIRAMQCTAIIGCFIMAIAIAYSHLPRGKRIPHVTPRGIILLGAVITLVSLVVGLTAVEML